MKLIIIDDPYRIHKEKDEDVIKFTPLLTKKVIPFEIDRDFVTCPKSILLRSWLFSILYRNQEGIMMIERMKDPTVEEKINFCYRMAAMKGDEVECCFEDMLPENLEKSYNYYVQWEYKLRHEGE